METKQLPLFEDIPQEVLNQWMEDTSNAHRTYKEHDYVVRQGSLCRSLYILTQGSLRATMTNKDGKEITIENLSAPEMLAPAFLFGDENRFPVNLIAQTDCRLWLIHKNNLLQFMHDYPSVMQRFIAEISNRCVFLSKKLNEFALQDLRYRVINYLKTHGAITNQQQAASMLGVARPSLARILSELQKENIVKRVGNETVMAQD